MELRRNGVVLSSARPNPRLQRTPAALPPTPLSRKPLGRSKPSDWRFVLAAYVLTVIALGPTPALASDGELGGPFALDSTGSTYPLVMRLEGTTERKGDVIVVEVKSGLVRSMLPADLQDEGVVRHVTIAFGLGKDIENGWQMINDTDPQNVAFDLKPGESFSVSPRRFVIRKLDERAFADQWLSARLTVDQKLPEVTPGLLSSYACSTVNLLGETAKSKDRKKRMLQNYSHAC